MRARGGRAAALIALGVAAACSSSYGSSSEPPADPIDAGADATALPSDAGADAFVRRCAQSDASLCLDFDGPPNPIWINQRRENGSTVEVDPAVGNPGASLHAHMPAADAGVAARAHDEIAFPITDRPMHVELDVRVKAPSPPLPPNTNPVFGIFIVYWGVAAVTPTLGPSNVDTNSTMTVYVSSLNDFNLAQTGTIPFDTWVHLAMDAQLTNGTGHIKVVGPGFTVEDSPPAAPGPAQATSLTFGISRYNGATPQLDVWYDNIVVTFP